jgi:hypothetical protein
MMQASAYPSSTTICRGWRTVTEASEAVLAALGEYSMQDAANGLRRIYLLRLYEKWSWEGISLL